MNRKYETGWLRRGLLPVALTIFLGLVLGLSPALAQEDSGEGGDSYVLAHDNPAVIHTMEVQDRHTDYLMDIPGVVGTGTGMNEYGQPAVIIFTQHEIGNVFLPTQLEGIPVIEKVLPDLGPASDGNGNGGAQGGSISTSSGTNTVNALTQRFTRPVPIGCSTSNWNECVGATIGVRVRNGTNYYVLSANHVFARNNYASLGEKIVQPGRGDVSCAYITSDEVGQLADYQQLVFSYSASNTMDAAIATTTPALTGTATPLDGYGTPNNVTKLASIGMEVQKYGRTTGLTVGKVYAINTTVVLSYSVGGIRFVNQIVVEPKKKNSTFVDGGDSGSLLVTNDASVNPLGLVFGKSSNYAIVSPIDPILQRFNVEIDNGTSPLPVELEYFSGALMGDDVHLKWRTTTELQNHGFFVQRSQDKDRWEDLEMIPGAGNSSIPIQYSYVDRNVTNFFGGQRLYYRLLQVDRDGTETYSSVLDVDPLPRAASMVVFPHPVRSSANVQVNVTQDVPGDLHVYDATGRRLDQFSNTLPGTTGTYNVPLQMGDIGPGNYFLEYRTATSVLRKRILVVR
ncbi:MAG: hypothetical protein C0600_15100 [Ignavibacteria bacterium]|nr:MAG: hypothetical protein C0600_15100 [Ignavibacteria bacterium]